jgi:KipI family sensor histidine kinase inhibitor
MNDQVRVLPYGDRALLVEVGDPVRAVAWADALADDPPPGLGDLVPAAETVLVVAADGADLAALRTRLLAVRPTDRGSSSGSPSGQADVVEIPVRYDGPDLEDVAGLTGLSLDEVVEAHAGRDWRVAFGGFAPGFAYLVDGDPRLHVPRRDSSRTTVQAGAVGLAGEFSGVYPRESPGGWQLIGTTDLPMWDLDRDPPALLSRGARVRFVAVDRS